MTCCQRSCRERIPRS